MASFPTSVVSPTDPTSGNFLSSPSHSQEHQSHNAEIVAVETKLGTGASTPANNTFLIGNGAGTSAFSGLTSAQLAARISDETGSGAAVFGTGPTIAAPVVTTGTFASPVLTTPAVVTSINDANGNEIIKTPATASATNEITVTNAANGTAPKVSATGSSDTNVNLNLQGKGTGSVQINGTDIFAPFFDHVVSGIVISADSVGVNKNYSITSGVVCLGGNFLTVGAVSAQTVGASKDRYIDLTDNGDGTAVYVTNEVNNNAASQALSAGNMRIGIVVAGATTIAATGSLNQGQEDRLLPIASSIPYAVTDSLGNLICPRDPNRRILGYRQSMASDFNTASGTAVQITGLSCPVIVPTGRKIEITFGGFEQYNATTGDSVLSSIWDGTVGSGTQLNSGGFTSSTANYVSPLVVTAVTTPATASKTYNAGLQQATGGTAHLASSSIAPSYIIVRLA